MGEPWCLLESMITTVLSACFSGFSLSKGPPGEPQWFPRTVQWLIATLGSSLRETLPLFWRFLGRLSVIPVCAIRIFQFFLVDFRFSVFSLCKGIEWCIGSSSKHVSQRLNWFSLFMICIVVVVFSYLFALPFFDFPYDAFCSVAVFVTSYNKAESECCHSFKVILFCFHFIRLIWSVSSRCFLAFRMWCNSFRRGCFEASPSNGWTLMSLTFHDYHRSECLFSGFSLSKGPPGEPQWFPRTVQWVNRHSWFFSTWNITIVLKILR